MFGPYANDFGNGLKEDVSYQQLIQEAFDPKWWKSEILTPEGYAQMEANFSLFWGLGIGQYEATLVPDQTPHDAWVAGNPNAIGADAIAGLQIFLNEGKCINCHSGPEFAGATVSALRPPDQSENSAENLIGNIQVNARSAIHNRGFYNIGVRPTLEDLGVGALIRSSANYLTAIRMSSRLLEPIRLSMERSIHPHFATSN